MSFIIENDPFFFHKTFFPTHPFFIFALVKVTIVVAVWSQSAHRCTIFALWRVLVSLSCSWDASRYCTSFFLRGLMCSVGRLISICCLATVSTETAKLAANSDRGPLLAYICVVDAVMLSIYPSKELNLSCNICGSSSCFSVLFRRAPHQTVWNLRKVFVLPLKQLPIVSWRHKPRETYFYSQPRFVCPPGVSTTPGFPFHTHLTVGEISAPQRADTRR